MSYFYNRCNSISEQPQCPKCGSALLKRGHEANEPPAKLHVSPASRSSYFLVHTLGRCRLNRESGDGAYSEWLHGYFERLPGNCVGVDRLLYDGNCGNAKEGQAESELLARISPSFRKICERISATGQAGTIVLNWHFRATGTPNGWTGRGFGCVGKLVELANSQGLAVRVVVTVHEIGGYDILKGNPPTAVVALNPEVAESLKNQMNGIPDLKCFESKVPNLMRSVNVAATERVLEYLGVDPGLAAARDGEGATDAQAASAGSTNRLDASILSAALITELRLAGVRMTPEKKQKIGILIFGTITKRHGLSVENIRLLESELARIDMPDSFRIYIAGSETNEKIFKDLRELANASKRTEYFGKINELSVLYACPYAISLDPLGFRPNASAMVNMIRAGKLLFSRKNDETSEQLIRRAVLAIQDCERDDSEYRARLVRQQGRFYDASGAYVGEHLARFFDRLVKDKS